MDSSFDENLCPQSTVFILGNKKSRLGIDLMSKEGDQAVEIVIRGSSPW